MTTNRRSCAVIGLGNIGSHAAMLVARLPLVGRVVLVDFDRVEEKNLSAQSVGQSDVGRPKAAVMGRQLRAARPDLEVTVHACRLQDVPLGELRADVVLGCLDSRASRMALNERAVALGIPLIDAGVAASGLLARVSVLGSDGPCLECSWDDEAYANVETVYACEGREAAVAPTSAPAFLGAMAATFQAARCSEILSGARDGLAKETVLDLAHGKLFVSSIAARPTCRLAPHAPWTIERLATPPAHVALADAFDFAAPRAADVSRSLEVSRGPFATRLQCLGCGAGSSRLRLVSSLTARDRLCRRCGAEMVAGGMDQCERLDLPSLGRATLARSLASVGARVGDVITVRAGESTRRFQLTMPPQVAIAMGAAR